MVDHNEVLELLRRADPARLAGPEVPPELDPLWQTISTRIDAARGPGAKAGVVDEPRPDRDARPDRPTHPMEAAVPPSRTEPTIEERSGSGGRRPDRRWLLAAAALAAGVLVGVAVSAVIDTEPDPPPLVDQPDGDAAPVVPLELHRESGVDFTGSPTAFADGVRIDTWRPAVPGAWPSVVLLPSWTTSGYEPLAEALSEQGYVVHYLNHPTDIPAQPETAETQLQQQACAVQWARSTAADHGSTSQEVMLVAHEISGPHGALLALAGTAFAGSPCTVDAGSPVPDVFVGLGGVYDLFSGGDPSKFPQGGGGIDDWPAALEPFDRVTETTSARFVLIEASNAFRSSGEAFAAALEDAGHEVSMTTLATGSGDLRYLDNDPGRETLQLIVDAGRDNPDNP